MLITVLAWSLISIEPVTNTGSEAPSRDQQPIIVRGTKDKERKAEEPYSTTPRQVTGSRIKRVPLGRRVFTTVATDTGVAGLLTAKDNNMDGTGGMVPLTRKKLVKECKADHTEVSELIACALSDVAKAMEAGQYQLASDKLATLKGNATLNSSERYYVAVFSYRLAEAQQDTAARETALKAMLASGTMPEQDQLSARKILISLALTRGDDRAATTMLEQLVAAGPADARSHANLAALYERSGLPDKARTQMAEAVEAIKQTGGQPPSEWINYLQRERR